MRLAVCRRADRALFDCSLRLYHGEDIDVRPHAPTSLTRRHLAYTHRTRIAVNEVCQAAFADGDAAERLVPCDGRFDKKGYEGGDEEGGDADRRRSQDVRLRVGYPLVCHKTNKAMGVKNSERFEVTALGDETFTVRRVPKQAQRDAWPPETLEAKEAERLVCRYVDAGGARDKIGLHRVFRPGYCVTVHQAQGDTFAEPFTIHDWNHRFMAGAGRYVAFTRARAVAQVAIAVDDGWSRLPVVTDDDPPPRAPPRAPPPPPRAPPSKRVGDTDGQAPPPPAKRSRSYALMSMEELRALRSL